MALKELYFQQWSQKLKPKPSEVFATASAAFKHYPLEMYVIGSSHQLCVGSHYTERLACQADKPPQFNDSVQTFYLPTEIGTFHTTIWQETVSHERYEILEKSYLKEAWDLHHCFAKEAAFTGLKINPNEILTIHTYPEYNCFVFSKTRLTS